MNKFLGLSIVTKITLGYLPLALISIVLSIYTLSSLNKLGAINRGIINNNMAIIEISDNLTDSLLAQEAFGQKNLMLNNTKIRSLFSTRDIEFERGLKSLQSTPESDDKKIEKIISIHNNYNNLYFDLFDQYKNLFKQDQVLNQMKIKNFLDIQLKTIYEMKSETRKNLEEKIVHADVFSKKVIYVSASLSILGIMIGIGAAWLITRNVAYSINQLKLGVLKFSRHQFDFIPDVNKNDEFGISGTGG